MSEIFHSKVVEFEKDLTKNDDEKFNAKTFFTSYISENK